MRAKATILCKLNKNDSPNKRDEWFKYFIEEVEYKKKTVTNMSQTVSGNGFGVAMGSTYTILIPFHTNYVPYEEWKGLIDKSKDYTLSNGDYILLGEFLQEEVNCNNIQQIKNSKIYKLCELHNIFEVRDAPGCKYRLKIEGI